MSFPGLPDIPKSLQLSSNNNSKSSQLKMVRTVPRTPPREPPPPPPPKTSATLDRRPSSSLEAKLATLKKEMTNLRQMDMQLMNQLHSLQQSIHELKNIMSQPSDLSPQSAIDPWELNHPLNANNDYYSYPLSSVRENDALSSSSVSSASGDKQ